MGFIIGILAIVLVLFMIVAMALAEWADKDPGDLIRMIFPKRPVSPLQAAAAAVQAGEPEVVLVSKKPAVKTAKAKAARVSSSPKRAKNTNVKRKAK